MRRPEMTLGVLAPGGVRRGPRIAMHSLGGRAARSSRTGRVPRACPTPDRGADLCSRARSRCVARRLVQAPHNETLQLPGADFKEVVVAAALAGLVGQQHLPSMQAARS